LELSSVQNAVLDLRYFYLSIARLTSKKQRIFPSAATLTQPGASKRCNITFIFKAAPCEGFWQQRVAPSSSLGAVYLLCVPCETALRGHFILNFQTHGRRCACSDHYLTPPSDSAQICRGRQTYRQLDAKLCHSVIMLHLASQAAPTHHQQQATQFLSQQ
jgi:hypothetical protein